MQLVDELSMIYTTCLMCYATFSYGKSKAYSISLAIFLLSLSLFITLYYHYLQDPAFHQNAYGVLTAIVVFRSIYVMEVSIRPKFKDQGQREVQRATRAGKSEQQRQDRRDKDILRRMWLLIACGLSIFLGGFAIWNVDNEFCSILIVWRRQIGLPWGILLEGHGWW
jgi:dihydroceramidase